MNRLGWLIVGLIVLSGAAFLAMTSFGSSRAVRPSAVEVAAPAARPGELVVPVMGVERSALTDSWGDARAGGARQHHGTDIMAAARTPVLAAAPGTIEKLFQSDAGGTTLYVRSLDGRWSYYYAHLAGYAKDIREGLRVRAGDRLGYVGDTGDAGAGNYHLHFGLARLRRGKRWWQGEEVNPFPLLATGRLPS